MVAFFCPPPFMLSANVVPLAVENGGTATAGSATSPSFSAAIGTASADRWVIAFLIGTNTSALSSATIGGVAATIVRQGVNGTRHFSIIAAKVPTGTTATIVANYSGGSSSSFARWIMVRGNAALTVVGSNFSTSGGAAMSHSNLISNGGAIFAASFQATTSISFNTGVGTPTENADTFAGVGARNSFGLTTLDTTTTVAVSSATTLISASFK